MSMSITSVIGFGVKVEPKVFLDTTVYGYQGYDDDFLDEGLFPSLKIIREGYAGLEGHWIMLKPSLTTIYSSGRGDTNYSKINGQPNTLLPVEYNDSLRELLAWQKSYGHENYDPSWVLVQYIN